MRASHPTKQTLTTLRIWLSVHNKQVIVNYFIFISFKCTILWHVLNISYIWIARIWIKPPFPYEIKNKYFKMEYSEMEAYVNQQREKWKTYGCTIMFDRWIESTKLSIINFMMYSKGTKVFFKLVDASNIYIYIYELLKSVIKYVGEENIVQLVTDNGLMFVKAGKLFIKKFYIY